MVQKFTQKREFFVDSSLVCDKLRMTSSFHRILRFGVNFCTQSLNFCVRFSVFGNLYERIKNDNLTTNRQAKGKTQAK